MNKKVFSEVNNELLRQQLKWGEQNHNPFKYLSILTEEVGEVAMAINDSYFADENPANIRKELIQTAAVAIAMIECLDRGKWENLEKIENQAPQMVQLLESLENDDHQIPNGLWKQIQDTIVKVKGDCDE